MNTPTNRARRAPGSTSQGQAEPVFSIDAALLENYGGQSQHTLFAPMHYEPGYAYPLMVWLHGHDGDERQLMRIMPSVSMRNYVAVAPRGTERTASGGYTWGQTEEQVQAAEQRIFDCIHTARQKLHVAADRVFLAGFDCGGTMAFRAAMNQPQWFAGVLSLGGAFPTGRCPLGNLAEARRLHLFVAVGRDSLVYGPEQVCNDLRLFHAAGMSATLRQYPCGHELTPQMLSDVDRWIIEQITGTRDAQTEAGCRQG